MRCGLGLDGREEGEDDEMMICSIFQHVKGELRPCEVLVVDGVLYWIQQITWLTFQVTISTDNRIYTKHSSWYHVKVKPLFDQSDTHKSYLCQ